MHSLFLFVTAFTDPSNLTIALGAACLAYGFCGVRWARRSQPKHITGAGQS